MSWLAWTLLLWLVVADVSEYLFSIEQSRLKGEAQTVAYYFLLAPLLAVRAIKVPISRVLCKVALTQMLYITEWFRS